MASQVNTNTRQKLVIALSVTVFTALVFGACLVTRFVYRRRAVYDVEVRCCKRI
jgi:hypothetical protein